MAKIPHLTTTFQIETTTVPLSEALRFVELSLELQGQLKELPDADENTIPIRRTLLNQAISVMTGLNLCTTEEPITAMLYIRRKYEVVFEYQEQAASMLGRSVQKYFRDHEVRAGVEAGTVTQTLRSGREVPVRVYSASLLGYFDKIYNHLKKTNEVFQTYLKKTK